MRVLLGMPRYDSSAKMAAAQAFYHPSSPDYPGVSVRAISLATSLLTGCFNAHWAVARNEWEAGNADGFAMIHTDVGAEVHWLDVLHAELERTGADVIGVTMPIKDGRGLHSTAVEQGDHWSVRRLTSREVMALPETFTDEDVPGLLLNTGLWLCKLGPWCTEALFHIEDRIVRGPGGRWVAGTVPEDWNFSRQCRALGLKLACTRKVAAEHYGEQKWTNRGEFGRWAQDIQNAPTIPGWHFPRDVDGWLTHEEGLALAELAEGKDVLEIGSYCGRSTVCLAQTARSVTCVDTFDGRATPARKDTRAEFQSTVERYGVAGKVDVMRGTSAEVVPTLSSLHLRYDLAFVDGAHDRGSVLEDAALARSVLRPGGLVAFHDYKTPEDPGVTEAVDELIAAGARLVRTAGSVAVLEPAG